MLRKIEFLNRLFKLAACYDEMLDFFKNEKLISDFQLDSLKNDSDKAKYIVEMLENLKQHDKLLLLDYEWQILPIERLKLTVITERVSKEFGYRQ